MNDILAFRSQILVLEKNIKDELRILHCTAKGGCSFTEMVESLDKIVDLSIELKEKYWEIVE